MYNVEQLSSKIAKSVPYTVVGMHHLYRGVKCVMDQPVPLKYGMVMGLIAPIFLVVAVPLSLSIVVGLALIGLVIGSLSYVAAAIKDVREGTCATQYVEPLFQNTMLDAFKGLPVEDRVERYLSSFR